MVEISVIAPTYRPGGIDILLAGMRDQTFKDFEVVLVDRRYERRHDEVVDLARRYGVNCLHVPEHRRNGRWGCTSSALNTGFALAGGRVIIMLVDWTYCPPGWIEAHLKHHAQGRSYVLAPYYYHAVGITPAVYQQMQGRGYQMPPYSDYANQPKLAMKIDFDLSTQDARADGPAVEEDAVLRGEVFDEISVFEEGLFDPAWLPRMPPLPPGDPGQRDRVPGGTHYTWTHLKNESLLREVVVQLNGTDICSERGGRMSIDTEFGLRLSCSGVGFIWEPAALAHCINPRHGVCRVMPFGDLVQRTEGRWNLEDCQAFFNRREQEVRAGKFLAAPAPYTIPELAERLKPWRTADLIDTSGLDKPDLEFFGRDIYPDTPYLERRNIVVDRIDEPAAQPEDLEERLPRPPVTPAIRVVVPPPAPPPVTSVVTPPVVPPPASAEPERGISEGNLTCFICRQPIAKGEPFVKGAGAGPTHTEPCSHRIQ